MTSLLGRILHSFPNSLQRENLFTEAVAHLFEMRQQLCLTWLKEEKLIGLVGTKEVAQEYTDIVTQKWFAPLENHGNKASQVDLFIRVHRILEESFGADDAVPDVVMVESKIDSREGEGQLRRYAEHLDRMANVGSKTLVYITRRFDPKAPEKITDGLDSVEFKRLHWHDFYRFLAALDDKQEDALVKEVLAFMEEEGMARVGRFSMMDLMALSGIQRALEIIDETLDEEIRGELESLAEHPTKHRLDGRDFVKQIRGDNGYWINAYITQDGGLGCYVGYQLGNTDGSPRAEVGFWAYPNDLGKDVAGAVVKRISNRDGWQRIDLNQPEPKSEYEVRRDTSLAGFLQANNHVAAVKSFFVESIQQLREELTQFKKEHADLPWSGG